MAQYRTLTVPAAAAVELLAFWKRNAEQFTDYIKIADG